jgi:DNA polymerase I
LGKERIVIIDGNSLVNRAYYAIQRPMMTKDGLYTQGVYGFLSILQKIRNDYEPTHMLVAWDRKAPTFRHTEYGEYKAGRTKMPPELAMQLPILKEVLTAMHIAMYEVDGYEADDIIGTAAKRSEEAGLPAYVITGDRDALQLATDKTSVIITKKGISEFALYDDSAMKAEYGFDHQQFIDYKGLRGDPSDNIPGVPGVGEKTAIKLITEFGSIENLIQNADSIPSEKLRDRIKENAQIALMSKRLATIFTDVPFQFSMEDCRIQSPDIDKLIELYSRLEFKTHMNKLMQQEKGGAPKGTSETKDANSAGKSDDFPIAKLIQDTKEAERFLQKLPSSDTVILDIRSDDNHKGQPSLDGMEVYADGECVFITGLEDYIGLLQRTLSGKKIALTGFNLQRSYYVLGSFGVDLSSLSTAFDCGLAQYVLSPSIKAMNLRASVYETFHIDLEENFDKEAQIDLFSGFKPADLSNIGKKLALIHQLKIYLDEKIQEEDLEQVLYTIEFPLCKVLADMERRGVQVDKEELTRFGQGLKSSIKTIEKEIYALAGEEFNINSPQQLGVVLFDKLGLPGAKKTQRGYATNVEVLERLSEEFPLVQKVLEYRSLAKLNSTYVEGLLPLIDAGGKIHAHFQQTVAATGRISCTEPNLQNIPIRQDLGRQLRKSFVAENSDYTLVGADYSQIELRVLAHMSKDPSLIEAFNKGLDIHKITASRVFGVPEDQVTESMRSNAKVVNFGVIYGMSGFGLSNELTITRKDAEHYINEYFLKYKAVKQFMDDSIRICRQEGSVRTLFGRKRSIPEIKAAAFPVRQQGERLAMNTPIQGTAADIIKLAMAMVYEALHKECPKSSLILQIHDELIIQAHKSETETVKKLLMDCMQNAAQLDVKLEVSLNEGANWYLLK